VIRAVPRPPDLRRTNLILPPPPPLPILPPPAVLVPIRVLDAPPIAAVNAQLNVIIGAELDEVDAMDIDGDNHLPDPAQLQPVAEAEQRQKPQRQPQKRARETEDALVAVEPDEPDPKRHTRNPLTYMVFVEPFPNFDQMDKKRAYCKLGCIEKDQKSLKSIAVSSTDNVKDHVVARHHQMWLDYEKAENNLISISDFKNKINQMHADALARLQKLNANTLKHYRKIDSGLDKRVRDELTAMIWAISNNVSRVALNCPYFDAYLSSIGGFTLPNRHDLSQVYVPELDQYVINNIRKRLSRVKSVSISSDGWKDRRRRNWMISGLLGWVRLQAPKTRGGVLRLSMLI